MKNAKGWRELNEEQGFWRNLKNDYRESRYKKANTMDFVFLITCMVISVTLVCLR